MEKTLTELEREKFEKIVKDAYSTTISQHPEYKFTLKEASSFSVRFWAILRKNIILLK